MDFFNGATRTPEFRALNAMGEVPVLETPTGVLSQSGAILAHLAQTTGKFGSVSDPEVLPWLLWDNHKGSTAQGMLRFIRNCLPEDKRNSDVITFQQGRATAALTVLGAHLAGREWLAGDALSIADISACSYLYYPGRFGYDPDAYPAIAAWIAHIADQPGWMHPYDLMPRA